MVSQPMQDSFWNRGKIQVRIGVIHKPEREKNLSAASQIKDRDLMFLPNTEIVTELYPHTRDKIICAWRKLR